MKKHITLLMTFACLLLALSDANSGLLGDVVNDGIVGLPEAINALQIAAGVRSGQSTSYVMTWRGTWAANQNYLVYDAVQFNGSSYICLQNHTSAISNIPPHLPEWALLALKGDTGATGPVGPAGDPGTGATGPRIIHGTVSIATGQIINSSVATQQTFNGLSFSVDFSCPLVNIGGNFVQPTCNSIMFSKWH